MSFETSDLAIAGPYGDIPVRLYTPETSQHGLIWAHGGAFIGGGLDQLESDWVARQLAARGITVVAVDYRRAPVPEAWAGFTGMPARPGVHFPVASEEVTRSFLWATRQFPHIDPSGWSLGGASAGANLAAGAAMRLRDGDHPMPSSLVLAYGLFHPALPPLPEDLAAAYSALPPDLAVNTSVAIQMIVENYVGDPRHLKSPYAFAAGHDLRGLPPTFVLNSDVDSVRASGEIFASELASAGVDTLVIREIGALHGHLDRPEEPEAMRSIDKIALWIDSNSLGGHS